MNWQYTVQREQLARELKYLIGYGATPERTVACPLFRNLTLAKCPGVELRDLGAVMVDLVKEAVEGLPEIEAQAASLLLKLKKTTWSAEERRLEAIITLKQFCSVENWRRIPELNFMRGVADRLLPLLEPAEAAA